MRCAWARPPGTEHPEPPAPGAAPRGPAAAHPPGGAGAAPAVPERRSGGSAGSRRVWERLFGAGGFKGAPAPTPGRAAPQECARRPARNATLVSCYFGSRGPGPLRRSPFPPRSPYKPKLLCGLRDLLF